MTLARLRSEHKALFNRSQDWFSEELFMLLKLPEPLPEMPDAARTCREPDGLQNLPHAVTLAALYVQNPECPIWQDYLWTCDFDRQGQRVYVGGTANGRGFEIHRHIHLTNRFKRAVWL